MNDETKNLTDAIAALSTKEMEDLLIDLQSTPYWPAILKYNGDRMEMAKNALMTMNAHKEPERISQTQGILAGLSDLYGAVTEIQKRRDKAAQSEQTEVPAKE